MERKCPQCQAPFMETQRFCRFCGYRLDQGVQDYVKTQTFGQATSPAPQSFEATSGYSAWSPPAAEHTTPLAKKKRGRKLFYVAAAVALWIALGAGIGYFTLTPDSNEPAFFGRGVSPASSRSYLGVTREREVPGGAFIEAIANEGGPADQAGLIGGDLITDVDGRPVRSWVDLRRVLNSTPPGSQLKITLLRDGREMETVLVTAAPGDFSSAPAAGPHGFFGIGTGGLERVKVPGQDIYGVRLDSVLRNRPAETAGVREGDIVIEFNGYPIRTRRALIRRINQTEPYSSVDVKVMRRGEELTIPVRMGRDR